MSATMTTCTTTSCQPLAARESRSFLAWIAEVVVREFRVRRDMRVLASFDEAALHEVGRRAGVDDLPANVDCGPRLVDLQLLVGAD